MSVTAVQGKVYAGYRAFTTNVTASTEPSLADTLTRPAEGVVGSTANGVKWVGRSDFAPSKMVIEPYGVGADGTDFTVYVFGWRKVAESVAPDATTQWHATLINKFVATLGTQAGVSGGVVTNSQSYADTVADPTVGTLGTTCFKVSNGANLGAAMVVLLMGHEIVEVRFKIGTATSANAILSYM